MEKIYQEWALIEMFIFPAWQAANEKERKKIITKTVDLQMKLFNKHLEKKLSTI